MKFRRLVYTIGILSCFDAWAINPIVRPHFSTRAAGMGGTRITTGLYDDNFFANPARVTANPYSKFTLFDLTPGDISSQTMTVLPVVLSGGNVMNTLLDSTGKTIHHRTQMVLPPTYYHAAIEDRKWAFAFGLIENVQVDGMTRANYQMELQAYADTNFAFSLGRKLLEDDALSVGATVRLSHRVGGKKTYGVADYVQGRSLDIMSMLGEGTMADFDLGATYRIGTVKEFDITAGFAVQNVLGGQYNLPIKIMGMSASAPEQPRSYGLGVSMTRAEWWKLTDTTFAVEFTDVLNNRNGSIAKLVHIGAETHWKSIAIRAGLNQGYWTAGLGFDFRYFTLLASTYGEELGLNAGSIEDRRYVASLGIHF